MSLGIANSFYDPKTSLFSLLLIALYKKTSYILVHYQILP